MPFGLTDAGTACGTNAIYQRCNPRLGAMGYGFTARVLAGRVYACCLWSEPSHARSTRSRRLEAVHGDVSKHKQGCWDGFSRRLGASSLTAAHAQPRKAIAPSTQGKRDTAEQASLSCRQPPAS